MKKLSSINDFVDKVATSTSTKLKLILVEGYEMVGKTTFISKVRDELLSRDYSVLMYRPDYKKLYPKIQYHERGYLGMSALELYSQVMVHDEDAVLIIDRSIFSAIVYDMYYHGFTRTDVEEKWMKPSVELLSDYNLFTVYVSHADKESAQVIYRRSLEERGADLDEYDIFEDFNEYYMEYMQLSSQFIADIDEVTHQLDTAESYIYYTDYLKSEN